MDKQVNQYINQSIHTVHTYIHTYIHTYRNHIEELDKALLYFSYSTCNRLQWAKLLLWWAADQQSEQWCGRQENTHWPGPCSQECSGGGRWWDSGDVPGDLDVFLLTETISVSCLQSVISPILCLQPEGLPREYTYSVFFCPNGKYSYSPD